MEKATMLLVGGAVVGIVGATWLLWKVYHKTEDSDHSENETNEIRKYMRLPVGRLTLEQIREYNGTDNQRILISICGRIFDMTSGYDFYGPGGAYNCFSGGDASFMLGKMSLDTNHKNKKDFVNTNEWDGDAQVTLSDWISRFRGKYPIVGRLNEFEDACNDSWRESGFDDVKNNESNIMTFDEFQHKTENWISVAGYVFDVTSAMAIYSQFGEIPNAVHNDITLALLQNDYKTANYNQPLTFLNENQKDKQRLQSIFNAFHETYPIVGRLSDTAFKVTWDNDN